MKTRSSLLALFLLGGSLFAQLPVGKNVPDLTAFDADGKKFPLKENLRGGYSVVVFGCLT